MKSIPLLSATALLALTGTVGAQVPWNQVTATGGPSVRERPACASDGAVLYLCGGNAGTTSATIYDDLWSFDGTTWTEVTADGTGCGERTGHAMAWDEARGKLVVFGGVTAPWPTRLGDTWEWDSVNGWVDVTPVGTSPSPRSFMAHAYVPGLGLVIHAGQQAAAPHASDTWAWDGTTWTLLATGPERNVSAMAYRPAPDDDLILFGGTVSATGGTRYDETWRFDVATSTWSQLAPATTPPAALGMAMWFDELWGEVVMHGGNAATSPSSATWTFDGDWTDATPSPAGPSRRNAGTAYVAGLGKGLHACGHNGSSPQGDLWARGYEASFTTTGTSCTGSTGLAATVSGTDPRVGHAWTFTMDDTTPGALAFAVVGFSDTVWSGIPLPVALSVAFPASPAGCLLQVAVNTTEPMAGGAGSPATLVAPIPADTGLLGAQFFAQGVQAEFTTGLSLVGADYGVGVIGN